jgi:hypothetical protein
MAPSSMHRHRLLIAAAFLIVAPQPALAQRELHWDRLDVTAHLDESGTLHVEEVQSLVFTGDWNGGERRFTVHPRQRLIFRGMSREDAGDWQPLTEDSSIDNVDEYAVLDGTTLRWRSRLPSDPPFANRTIRYQLRYEYSGILLRDDDIYTLDHEFAFRERAGPIDRFHLRLTVDPVWQPGGELRSAYTAGPLAPGETFVLTLPMRYAGAGAPSTLDRTRPPAIALAVLLLFGATITALLWFFIREQRYGRFVPLATQVDERWLREHVLRHPAEVVGAAWDETVGPAEVVALIARMVEEGKLASSVDGSGPSTVMSLRLEVDRGTLSGYERALVDALFFNNRTGTSTALVRSHYRATGFDPAEVIRRELDAAVARALPTGSIPRRIRGVNLALFSAGAAMFVAALFFDHVTTPSPLVVCGVMLVLAGVGWAAGLTYRARLELGMAAALVRLLPALLIAGGACAYLWFYAGAGHLELTPLSVAAMTAMALALTLASINALKSRQRGEGMALRKHLAAGRAFFATELRREQPALRDEWYPWLLAFGLSKDIDTWTAQRSASHSSHTDFSGTSTPSSASTPTISSERWTGFAGGRSGGAGGGASWQAAATGLAAPIAAPSSSSSSGGSSGGGSSSSSSGSSGGGGGGGW